MKRIEAYRCADGSLHEDESKAKAHEDDLLGQELDGLLRLFNLELTRSQEYKGLLSAMKNRKELSKAVKLIDRILDHGGE